MFPTALTSLRQWVVFSVRYLDNGKKKVMPFNPKASTVLKAASHSDSRTWGTFEEAQAAQEKDPSLYLGLALENLVGIDFDTAINESELANQTLIYNSVVSYTEQSMSGKGAHIICYGTIPYGVKRGHVEIYGRTEGVGSPRFFIMTGKPIPGRPTEVLDCNDIVNTIVKEAGDDRPFDIEHDEEQKRSDEDIYNQCVNSSNGAKFKQLWDGDFSDYSSQSEADFALLNFLAFATHNNEQTRRLFRLSRLGDRQKADRDDYLDSMIGRIRAEQHKPLVTFSPEFLKEPKIAPLAVVAHNTYSFPEGLVGEIAEYILATAYKPLPQIALVAAVGLVAGMAGRTYNISSTGLNLYLLILAPTGIGKEGGTAGAERIIHEVAKKFPSVLQFWGPGTFASGQGMIKQLVKTPCMVSFMGEFGHTLSNMCHPHATSAEVMTRKLYLELFNKSGPTARLGRMVYSDDAKNTAEVESPAYSVVADATPESVFEGLSDQAIEIGLVPRFLVVECNDKRPPTNRTSFGATPPDSLISKVEALAVRCMSMSANGTRQAIQVEHAAQEMLNDFDAEIDKHINDERDNAIRQIWSRSHLKALRLAGILAVGMNADTPYVRATEADWAINFVRADARIMSRYFRDGVGGGNMEQASKVRTAIVQLLRAEKTPKIMKEKNVITAQLLVTRLLHLTCFAKDRMGANRAAKETLAVLCDWGELRKLNPAETKEHILVGGESYAVQEMFQWPES